jgi:hypothetical protein
MQPAWIRTESIPTTVLKASRSVLVLRLLAAVLAGLVAIVGWTLGIFAVPVFLGITAIAGIAGVARAAVGAIHVSPAGIKFRSGMRTAAIRWTDVHQFVEVIRPWGQRVVVDKTVAKAMPLRFAMPAPSTSQLFFDPAYDRDVALLRGWAGLHDLPSTARTRIGFGNRMSAWAGFVVLMLLVAPLDRPFGWISGAQATAVPVACAALSDAMFAEVGAVDADAGSHSPTSSSCSWRIAAGTLSISYHLFSRKGLHGGSDRAAEDQTFEFTDYINNGFTTIDSYQRGALRAIHAPVRALASQAQVLLLSQAANVNITIEMSYENLDASLLAALTDITNTAIGAVRTA